MRIPAWTLGVVLAAGCGGRQEPAPAPAEKPVAGTSETCAAICEQKSPRTADYVTCLEGCPGPETVGEREAELRSP